MLEPIQILGQTTSWLEVIAMLTGILGVWLTIQEKIWCFPIGIINVALYGWLFLSPGIRLYADALLQGIYIFLLVYGWSIWSMRKKEKLVPVKVTGKTSLSLFLVCIAGTILLAAFFSTYTDASYPWLDSALTCASLGAQWMIARKLIENWIVWIVADIIYIPLYLSKQLPLTAILYFIFLLLAFRGYSDWKKNMIHA